MMDPHQARWSSGCPVSFYPIIIFLEALPIHSLQSERSNRDHGKFFGPIIIFFFGKETILQPILFQLAVAYFGAILDDRVYEYPPKEWI